MNSQVLLTEMTSVVFNQEIPINFSPQVLLSILCALPLAIPGKLSSSQQLLIDINLP